MGNCFQPVNLFLNTKMWVHIFMPAMAINKLKDVEVAYQQGRSYKPLGKPINKLDQNPITMASKLTCERRPGNIGN
ncbi:hypothetical protein ABIB50_003847 [Mucilaginibacter sp. UYCu711]